ncbi:DUF2125 domain-containing protein [Roseivivax sp. CAU 1761]
MKRLLLVIVAAALLYSGYWLWQARATRAALEDWLAATPGVTASEIAVRGFPSRVDVTFEDLRITDAASGTNWHLPFLQVFRLVYDPSHYILALPERLTAESPGDRVAVESRAVRASLVLGEAGRLARLHFEATTLTVSSERQGRLDLRDLRGALDALAAEPPRYGLAVAAEIAEASGGDAEAPATAGEGLTLRATLETAAPLAPGAALPPLTRIELALAEAALDGARLRLEGDAEVDGGGGLDGDLDLEARNWPALLDAAQARGTVTEGAAEGLRALLGLIAAFRGDADTLEVGLRLDDSRVYLGPFPLGELPRLPERD